MRSAFVKVNRVPTRVTCWGKWIEESFTEGDSKDIILLITGNPGITSFYNKFLETIHQQTGYNVWVLSHAGHELPMQPTVMEMPTLRDNSELFDLNGQIDHKVAFIKQYVPADCRLHLLGHSIGAYICTNLLKDPLLKEKIEKAYLLFPTIERMAISPNGKFYMNVVQYIQSLLVFLASIFALFPLVVRTFCTRVVLCLHGTPGFVQPTLMLTMPQVVRAVFFLADDEMKSVQARDTKLIEENADKLFGYYGQTDGWTPISYCEDIKRDIPRMQVQLAKKEFQHAFVMKHSHEMGIMLSDLLLAK